MTIGRTIRVAVALVLVVIIALSNLREWAVSERIERSVLDLWFHFRGLLSPGEEIVIVAIDDATVSRYGPWPWPREQIADLLQRILEGKPKAVAFDAVFPERADQSGATERLAQIARASGHVIFPFYFGRLSTHPSAASATAREVPETVAHSTYLLFDFKGKLDTAPILTAEQLYASARPLVNASAMTGHFNTVIEEGFEGGTVRWEAQVVRYGLEYYPSLPVAIAADALALTRGEIRVEAGRGIRLGSVWIPTDRRGWSLVNYVGPTGTFPYVSALSILEGRALPEEFAGKIILVGVTAAGSSDVLMTPFSTQMPGVEKVATSVENILHQNYLRRPTSLPAIEVLLILVIGALSILTSLKGPRWLWLAFLLALAIGLFGVSYGLFVNPGVWFKPVHPWLATVLPMLCVAVWGAKPERRRRGLATPDVEVDEEGRLVRLGRYEIRQELGAGAMGKIYEGFDPAIGRKLAIKTLRVDVAAMGDEHSKQRFLREAQAAGALSHPNIVTIYDVGQAGGISYIAMEFLEGVTLQEIIQRKAPLALRQILQIVRPIAAALDYAHRQGVVHRDVKPANIMILRDGTVKVMDFGIARVRDSTMTMTGSAIGTPSYMSPEQFKGEVVDGRTDIFSLGVVIYEMATGSLPFGGDSLTVLTYNILHQPPPSPLTLNAELPSGLEQVLAKALAKERSERYQTAAELVRALEALAPSR